MMWKIAWICLSLSLLRKGIQGEESSRRINVNPGSDVVLECNVASNKNIELFSWRLNNSNSPFFISFLSFKPFIAYQFKGRLHIVNQSVIRISRVSRKDSGIYQCMAKMISTSGGGDIFVQGTPIKLNVQVQHPFFHELPRERVIVFEGSSIQLKCHVGGIPKPRINWIRLDNELPLRRTTIKPSGWLTIDRVEAPDAGRYMCSATNVAGTIDFEFDVEVERNPQVIPTSRKTSKEGYPVVLDCNIDSSISTTNARFIWTKNGTVISPSAKTGISVLVDGKLYIKKCSRKDSGVYKCTTRTLDPTGSSILFHPGQSVFLNVQFPPDIILIEDVASAAEGADARLPCVSKANPGTVSTTWSRGGWELVKPKYEVLQEGTLLVRSIKTSDAGTYTCTPSNSNGKGKSKSTRLVVILAPRFTRVPPSVKKVRIGKTIYLVCDAVSDKGLPVTLTWLRVNGPLPLGRSKVKGGHLTITNIQRGDYGMYACLASTTGEGTALHSTTVTVISTPGVPNITTISRSGRKATISWIPGHDGGHIQTFELWYRKSTDTDSQWKFTRIPSSSTTTYTLSDLELGVKYLFSVRGINIEGAGSFSERVFYVDKKGPHPVTDLSAPHVVSQHKPTNYKIPIVAGVLGSIIFVLLLCIAYVSFKLYNGRKKPEDKASKKFHFLRRDRNGQSKSVDERIYEDISEMEGAHSCSNRKQQLQQQESDQRFHKDIEKPSLKRSKVDGQPDNQSHYEYIDPKSSLVTNQRAMDTHVYIALGDRDPPTVYQKLLFETRNSTKNQPQSNV